MTTATVNGAAPHTPVQLAITRADRTWCQQACDDPLDDSRITHLAGAVQHLIEQPPASAGQADAISGVRAELSTLRADYATLAGERSEIAAANTRLTHELEQLRGRHDTLVDQVATAHRDNAQLADDLAAARATIQQHIESVTAVLAERDRLLEDLAAAEHHHCSWELDLPTGLHYDCSCGRPWPRDYLADAEPVEPELEPLDVLMARVREELAGWGETS